MFAELDLNPSRKKLVDFAGGMIAVSLLAIPVLIYFFNGIQSDLWVQVVATGLVASLVFATCRFLFPAVLKPLYVLWVGLSVVIGMVVGPILLTVVYYVVITPVGLLSKATGKEWIQTKKQRDFWTPLEPHKKESFEQQF